MITRCLQRGRSIFYPLLSLFTPVDLLSIYIAHITMDFDNCYWLDSIIGEI